jgi:hypothetical protein
VDAERAGRQQNLPALVAVAQLGRYGFSINDDLPSSRCGSAAGRF